MYKILINFLAVLVFLGCATHEGYKGPVIEAPVEQEQKVIEEVPQIIINDDVCDNAINCEKLAVLEVEDANYTKAAKYFQKACIFGNMKSCHNAAVLYEKGLGVEQDNQKAFILYNTACEGYFPQSCRNLGLIYQGKLKLSLAKEYFKKACDYGYDKSCAEYASLANELSEVEKSEYFTKACDGGSIDGCRQMMAKALKDKDEYLAIYFAKKACDLGDKDSCNTYEAMTIEDGKNKK